MNCLALVCVFYCSSVQESNRTKLHKEQRSQINTSLVIPLHLFQVLSWHRKWIRTPWRAASSFVPNLALTSVPSLQSCPGSSSSILLLLPSLFSPVLCPSTHLSVPWWGKNIPKIFKTAGSDTFRFTVSLPTVCSWGARLEKKKKKNLLES